MYSEPENAALEIAFIALGSNLGDRLDHLRTGVDALRKVRDIDVVAVSPVYESPAHTLRAGEEHPDFLNAVVEIATWLDARSLLDVLLRIEREAGRSRDEDARWAPRTLDLDLLIFGRAIIRNERLTVPHPGLGRRRFVLRPLADLAPDRYVPDPFNRSVRELLAECPDKDRPARTPFSL